MYYSLFDPLQDIHNPGIHAKPLREDEVKCRIGFYHFERPDIQNATRAKAPYYDWLAL